MSEILLINPSPKTSPKKKKKKKKKAKNPEKKVVVKMANQTNQTNQKKKKKKTNSGNAKTKTIIRYRNPPKKKRTIRRVARGIGQNIMGINVVGALKNSIPITGGMLAAKFAAKQFADGGAEGDNWTWQNYGMGLLGGFVAAAATQAVFRAPRATGQKVMEGAISLMLYKGFVNEIAPMNERLDAWFSGDEEGKYPTNNYLGQDEGWAEIGDVWQGEDADYMQGEDAHWRPINENHRLPATTMGDELVPVDPTMGFGDELVPVDPTMGSAAYEWDDAYNRR